MARFFQQEVSAKPGGGAQSRVPASYRRFGCLRLSGQTASLAACWAR